MIFVLLYVVFGSGYATGMIFTSLEDEKKYLRLSYVLAWFLMATSWPIVLIFQWMNIGKIKGGGK